MGATVALLHAGLIISGPGRVSSGHMNPAISLAMWRFDVSPAAGLALYIAAQFFLWSGTACLFPSLRHCYLDWWGFLIGFGIAVPGTSSGGSLNPTPF